MPQQTQTPPPKPTPPPAADRARAAWLDPRSFASTLLILFADRYGTEGLGWHPRTIATQVAEDFGVDEVPRQNLDRLLAAIALVTTDYFYKRLSAFVHLCNVLSGDGFDPTTFDPADAADCAWGITEALLISPPDEPEPFCDEIRYYLAEVLRHEGFVRPPDVLALAIGGDRSDQVRDDFADDDPEMFAALYQAQSARNDEVTRLVRGGIEALLSQVEALPLESGDASGLRQRLLSHVRVPSDA
jgi:hypothetical protein